MVILDTHVLSDIIGPKPDARVREVLSGFSKTDVHTTAINAAELWADVALLPTGKRRDRLAIEIARLPEVDFDGCVLPFDQRAAQFYGPIFVGLKSHGISAGFADAQIAAIAKSNGFRLATRNINDFAGCGIKLINPRTD